MPDCCVFIVIFVVRIIHQYDELLIRSASALHDTAGQQTGRYRHSTYMKKHITDGGPSAAVPKENLQKMTEGEMKAIGEEG